MNCTHCHYNYESGQQYCPNCGNKTLYNPRLNKADNNVTAVWLFFGLFAGTQLFYKFLSHVITPVLRNTHDWDKIGTLYKTVNWLTLLAELLVSGIVIAIIKNTSARMAVGLYAGLTLLMFVFERIMEAAKMGNYDFSGL